MTLASVLRLSLGPALALAVAGCQSLGGGQSAPPETAQPVDVRKFIGPDYCPQLSVRSGTEVLRRYERGHEDDKASIVWQASIGDTARECLYDGQGNLTIRIGVSGRVAAGPKGGAGDVTLPLRIAVTRAGQIVLSSDLHVIQATIPPELSTVFAQVYEVTVPSPGEHRDYLVYVGFDDQAKKK